jgi:hypothetical protein
VDLDGQIVERTRRGVEPGFGHMQVSGGSLEIAMTEQQLNTAQIGTGVKQVCGERVTQNVRAERLAGVQLLA